MAAEGKSPAYQLVKLVWDSETVRSEDRSWIRLNQALHAAVILAIEAKMPFATGDFAELYKGFHGHYWFGNSSRTPGEDFYRRAVKFGHAGACQSFEAFAERRPFILDTGARAAELTEVEWEGLRCVVTAFLGPELISLCHYENTYSTGGGVGNPKRRFKVTLADWREVMGSRRKLRRGKGSPVGSQSLESDHG